MTLIEHNNYKYHSRSRSKHDSDDFALFCKPNCLALPQEEAEDALFEPVEIASFAMRTRTWVAS